MSFSPPTFNLTCNVWSAPAYPPAPPRLVVACNLAWGRRIHESFISTTSSIMQLLLPAHTDIRCSPNQVPLRDAVEVPAGSGRFYFVDYVDDAGKGFPNEHRVAVLLQTAFFGLWPVPMP